MSFIESLPAKGAATPTDSNIGCFKPIRKPRGRPVGWRKNLGEEVSYTTVQIDSWSKDEIDREHRPKERISETIRRLNKEKSDKIQALIQENDQLKLEIDRLKGLLEVQGIKQN